MKPTFKSRISITGTYLLIGYAYVLAATPAWAFATNGVTSPWGAVFIVALAWSFAVGLLWIANDSFRDLYGKDKP